VRSVDGGDFRAPYILSPTGPSRTTFVWSLTLPILLRSRGALLFRHTRLRSRSRRCSFLSVVWMFFAAHTCLDSPLLPVARLPRRFTFIPPEKILQVKFFPSSLFFLQRKLEFLVGDLSEVFIPFFFAEPRFSVYETLSPPHFFPFVRRNKDHGATIISFCKLFWKRESRTSISQSRPSTQLSRACCLCPCKNLELNSFLFPPFLF